MVKAGSSQNRSPLVGLSRLSRSTYAVNVRQIDLGFETYASTDEYQSYVEDLAGLLSSCLVRFPRLSALEVHSPPSYLPQEERRVFIDTIVAALRYVPLPNLTELELSFPITHEFGKLFSDKASPIRIPIEDILGSLRHLHLSVTEYTGLLWQRYDTRPVSPANAALPNESYAIHLFRLVQAAINLDSLLIRCTDVLTLDNIEFSPSLRLKSLCLDGVSISSPKLISLVEQCKDTVKHIELYLVQLNSGTWQNVLMRISKLPRLQYFLIDSVGYSLTGSSSELAARLLPQPDNPADIETNNVFDLFALGNLQRQVNANRVATGLPPMSKSVYQHLDRWSLEFAMERFGIVGHDSV